MKHPFKTEVNILKAKHGVYKLGACKKMTEEEVCSKTYAATDTGCTKISWLIK